MLEFNVTFWAAAVVLYWVCNVYLAALPFTKRSMAGVHGTPDYLHWKPERNCFAELFFMPTLTPPNYYY